MNIPSIDNRMKRAWLLSHQRRFDLALAEISEILSIEPEHDEAHSLRGLCLATTDKAEEGLAALQKAIVINPHRADSYYFLACVYQIRGDLVASAQAIRRAIKLDPQNPYFWLTRAYLADDLSRRGVEEIEELLTTIDLGMDLHLDSGVYLGGLKEIVIELVEQALKFDPENVDALYLRLLTFYALNRLPELQTGCDELLAIDPSHAPTHNLVGILYQHNKQWVAAIKSCQTALQLQPNLADAYYNLVYGYRNCDRAAESIEFVKTSFRLDTYQRAKLGDRSRYSRFISLKSLGYALSEPLHPAQIFVMAQRSNISLKLAAEMAGVEDLRHQLDEVYLLAEQGDEAAQVLATTLIAEFRDLAMRHNHFLDPNED